MSGDDPVTIGEVTVTVETDKALLCHIDDDSNREMWVPKSVVHDDSEAWKKGDNGKLVVKAWWAEKYGYE